MFGYLNIDKTKLSDGERGLWQTFMCGLCLSTKNFFSEKARLLVNNDINFFGVLYHSFLEIDVEINHQRCASHPLKKRTILKPDELSDRLAASNLILTYFNLLDDVVDNKSFKKKLALSVYKKDFAKSKTLEPKLFECVERHLKTLSEFEKGSEPNLDLVCHPFAELSLDFCKIVLGEKFNQTMGDLCYNVGKWVFLIDALDDIKADLSKGSYNAFVSYYNAKEESFVLEKFSEIQFVMFAVLNKIAMCFNDLNLKKYRCILENVILFSMRDKTNLVLEKYKTPEFKTQTK